MTSGGSKTGSDHVRDAIGVISIPSELVGCLERTYIGFLRLSVALLQVRTASLFGLVVVFLSVLDGFRVRRGDDLSDRFDELGCAISINSQRRHATRNVRIGLTFSWMSRAYQTARCPANIFLRGGGKSGKRGGVPAALPIVHIPNQRL